MNCKEDYTKPNCNRYELQGRLHKITLSKTHKSHGGLHKKIKKTVTGMNCRAPNNA